MISPAVCSPSHSNQTSLAVPLSTVTCSFFGLYRLISPSMSVSSTWATGGPTRFSSLMIPPPVLLNTMIVVQTCDNQTHRVVVYVGRGNAAPV